MTQAERSGLFGLFMGHGILCSSQPDSLFRVVALFLMMLSGYCLVMCGERTEEKK